MTPSGERALTQTFLPGVLTEISILDLQNLRHLISGYSTTHCKMTDYASKAEDPEIKKLFQEAADSAMKNKQELMKFL